MSLIDIEEFERSSNPVDHIEQVALANDWSFERSGDDEITVSVKGNWCDYHVSFSWLDEFEALHLACAFDLKVPEPRRTEVCRLLALVNERMWMGHFDLWNQEGVVMYRHSLLLAGDAVPNESQIEGMLSHALAHCEQHYQAFQFVVWAGKNASEALDSSLFETVGEA
ncbi:hypothetical protein SAMN02745172_01006 [Pseudoxanthobacter soli DSM 19599]|uniref:Sensory transduction regulator n=1 Tax=Pseudoxanthobacter soli DSM 19599 TaxID=1123029 RepID=A0A1M7ZBW3_9HYPH|nr:YbjN domain-containing protein [Pseudoxanthobacter soli]SHO62401.1 hypothetical protein SAMN02745172_01006 [Pseudoxanthobacter soli DSM 19599]